MLFSIKLICGKAFLKDGSSTIYIQYCFSQQKRVLLHTQFAVPVQYWDFKKFKVIENLPSSYGNANDINQSLNGMMRNVEDILLFAQREKMEDPLGFLKKTFSPSFNPQTLILLKVTADGSNPKINKDFFFQIDNYIDSKLKKVSKDMGRIYRNMKDHLKAFEMFQSKAIHFEDLDLVFYEELVDFLSYSYVQERSRSKKVGLKYNTVGKTIKHLRAFLNDRIKKKIISPLDLSDWKVLEVETDAVYCSEHEIKRLANLDLSEYPHLINYRDEFVLGCLTGLRFSDFSQLREYDLRGDMLYKKQKKSNHWVVIPLRSTALKILKERFSKNTPHSYNSKFNKHIKTIAKIAGINSIITFSYRKGNKQIEETRSKYDWICSHTCRRSFCTNEFLAGTPVELIMKISGHKSLNDFYKYIRISPEEAAMKIKILWSHREMLVSHN